VPRLLDQWVASIVERHGVNDARFGRLIQQVPGFGRRHREWLV
jgi:hypothetical protein